MNSWTFKRGPSTPRVINDRLLFHSTSKGNEGIEGHVPRHSRVGCEDGELNEQTAEYNKDQ